MSAFGVPPFTSAPIQRITHTAISWIFTAANNFGGRHSECFLIISRQTCRVAWYGHELAFSKFAAICIGNFFSNPRTGSSSTPSKSRSIFFENLEFLEGNYVEIGRWLFGHRFRPGPSRGRAPYLASVKLRCDCASVQNFRT